MSTKGLNGVKFDYEQRLFAQITDVSTVPVNGSAPKKKQKAFDCVEEALKALGFDLETQEFSASKRKLPPVIHVAGTKGKGSVCSFTESILRHSGLRTGLFTSPHLVNVTERIKINGKPISSEKMQAYVDKVLGLLEQEGKLGQLGFFRLMTVLALYVYSHEAIDVVVLEVGLGGLLDATNVLRHKRITAVTLLDYDHTDFLGNTIEEIAAQKAGIFIEDTPALTVSSQQPSALAVLQETAKAKGNTLEVVDSAEFLSRYKQKFKLGLNGEHQYENAALAIRICELFVGKPLPEETLRKGLSQTKYFGRCQTLLKDNISYFIDGAHTQKSMVAAVKWLQDYEFSNLVLIFNCAHTKDTVALQKVLVESNLPFRKVYFVKPNSKKPSKTPLPDLNVLLGIKEEENLSWQQKQGEIWKHLKGCSNVDTSKTIDEALEEVKKLEQRPEVLVTGSLLLVGDALKHLCFDFDVC